jgi:hypothetical protein
LGAPQGLLDPPARLLAISIFCGRIATDNCLTNENGSDGPAEMTDGNNNLLARLFASRTSYARSCE